MPAIEIRPAATTDISDLLKIDHSVETAYTWQMDRSFEAGCVSVSFREMRLPRVVRLLYPRRVEELREDWNKRAIILVALFGIELVGYASLKIQQATSIAWLVDLVVQDRLRRQGIGSALVIAAQDWAIQQRLRRLVMEMQLRNHPGICLAQKLGFEFCGYNDYYYPNQDIALFFGQGIK